MTLQGTVYDTSTQQGIPSASLTVVDSSGNPLGGGVVADPSGLFMITSPQLDQGGKLLASSVGYSPVIADPSVITSTGFIGLNPSAQTLPAAGVTAKVPAVAPGASKYVPWLLGGGAVLLLSTSGKHKKKSAMGDIASFDWSKILIPGGIIIGGYFVGKLILEKLGLISTPSPQQQATANAQASSLAAAQAAAKAAGQQPSYTQDQYTGWANDIYTVGISENSLPLSADAQEKIVNDIINANTMLDLQLLISAFGQRQGNCAIFNWGCTTYDLDGWVKLTLDAAHLNTVNGYLAATNINYQF